MAAHTGHDGTGPKPSEIQRLLWTRNSSGVINAAPVLAELNIGTAITGTLATRIRIAGKVVIKPASPANAILAYPLRVLAIVRADFSFVAQRIKGRLHTQFFPCL
jgi:hypothetical protein